MKPLLVIFFDLCLPNDTLIGEVFKKIYDQASEPSAGGHGRGSVYLTRHTFFDFEIKYHFALAADINL